MFKSLVLGAVAALALTAEAARAENFDFSFSAADGAQVSGRFVSTSLGNDKYRITSIVDGFRNASPITLLPVGSKGSNNNILYLPPARSTYFDTFGITYSVGLSEFNLFYSSSAKSYSEFGYFGGASGLVTNFSVTASPVAVPGPVVGSGLISLLGFAGLWLAHRRSAA